MEPSRFRVRPYSAKSILILMMMAGFRNVLVHCRNVFSFVCEVGKRENEIALLTLHPASSQASGSVCPFFNKNVHLPVSAG